eukprot:TRINITY_DN16311_c0_g1_i1.p1 TRINITY_DN16311_c0_g1~~TRINITY_DN16311_c0_g1_i1.p1  ORF type:complete len:1229 (+),score=229.61 TRINITY_DN16311_c0_g1_i1:83-3688(+)
MTVSVRWALSAGGIGMLLLSVSVALVLSTVAGMLAIEQTNTACDQGLASCFTSGETNSAKLGDGLLQSGITAARERINSFLGRPTFVVETMHRMLSAVDISAGSPHKAANWRFLQTLSYQMLREASRDGVQELQTAVVRSGTHITYSLHLEDLSTVNRSDLSIYWSMQINDAHVLNLVQQQAVAVGDPVAVWQEDAAASFNETMLLGVRCTEACGAWATGVVTAVVNGTPHVSVNGSASRTFARVVKDVGGRLGTPDASGQVMPRTEGWGSYCDLGRPLSSNGALPSGPCVFQDMLSTESVGRGYLGWATSIRTGQLGWSPLESKGSLMALAAYRSGYADVTNQTYTFTTCGADVVKLSLLCHEITGQFPDDAKLYVVETNPWTKTEGVLVASSHGTAYGVSDSGTRVIINVTQSSDPVIATHGRHILSEYGTFSHFDNDTSQVPQWTYEGRVYLTKMVAVQDQTNGSVHQLLLHATVLVPKDTMFAGLDQATAAVKRDIDFERTKVDDELRLRIMWMIGVVAGCFVVLVTVCLMFAGSIARPIQTLAAQMDEVAAMRLDGVYTPTPSGLEEVRRMEEAFKTTVEALREYRKFLPAYVLDEERPPDDSEEDRDDDDEKPAGSGSTRMSLSAVFSGDGSGASGNQFVRETSGGSGQRNSGNSLVSPSPGPIAHCPQTPVRICDESTDTGTRNRGSASNLSQASHVSSFTKDPRMSIDSRRGSLGRVSMAVEGRKRRPTLTALERPGAFATGLNYRRGVAFLGIQLRDFEIHAAPSGPSRPSGIYGVTESVCAWVDRIEAAVKSRKGMLFSSALGEGEVCAVWGFMGRRGGAVESAVDVGLDLVNPEKFGSDDLLLRCPPHCGVVDKPAMTGNLGGTRTLSGPVIVGDHRADTLRMLRFAKELSLIEDQHHPPGVIVHQESSRTLLEQLFDVVPVDVVYLQQVTSIGDMQTYPPIDSERSRKCGLCSVVGKVVQTNEEWMYQLEEHTGKTRALFQAFQSFRKGDNSTARKQLRIAQQQGTELHRTAAENLAGLVPSSSPSSSLAPRRSPAPAGLGTPQQQGVTPSVQTLPTRGSLGNRNPLNPLRERSHSGPKATPAAASLRPSHAAGPEGRLPESPRARQKAQRPIGALSSPLHGAPGAAAPIQGLEPTQGSLVDDTVRCIPGRASTDAERVSELFRDRSDSSPTIPATTDARDIITSALTS